MSSQGTWVQSVRPCPMGHPDAPRHEAKRLGWARHLICTTLHMEKLRHKRRSHLEEAGRGRALSPNNSHLDLQGGGVAMGRALGHK